MTTQPHPIDPAEGEFIGFARLAKQVFDGVDLKPLGAQLLERAQRCPDDAHCLLDLSVILQFGGEQDELALALQQQALAMQNVYRLPAQRQPAALRLLALMTPGLLVDNLHLDPLLVDSDIDLIQVYVDLDALPAPTELPDHDLLLVAVGESDATQALLQQLDVALQTWPKPVLNRPARIADMARDRAAARLVGINGLTMPASVRSGRAELAALAHGALNLDALLPDGAFPIIVRPLGTHAGKGLEKLDSPAEIEGYLEANRGEWFTLSRFVDYSGADGMFRKYRVASIGGRPYACHMGVSEHWMVHYLNAGMTESAAKRAEEARFMEQFDAEFARRHQAAIAEIDTRLRLDYFAMDCAEMPDGSLLIFEVDTSMIVHAFDPESIFPYKQPHMRKLFADFRRFLLDAAKRPLGYR